MSRIPAESITEKEPRGYSNKLCKSMGLVYVFNCAGKPKEKKWHTQKS